MRVWLRETREHACIYNIIMYIHVHVSMREEKEERSKQGQTSNKAKQHSTPKAVNCIYMYLLDR